MCLLHRHAHDAPDAVAARGQHRARVGSTEQDECRDERREGELKVDRCVATEEEHGYECECVSVETEEEHTNVWCWGDCYGSWSHEKAMMGLESMNGMMFIVSLFMFESSPRLWMLSDALPSAHCLTPI